MKDTLLLNRDIADLQQDYLDQKHKLAIQTRIKDFYDQATKDYFYWDDSYNMHFGFYRWGINPFNLGRMLRQMNYEVFSRLQLDNNNGIVVDAGCGIGASAIQLAGLYDNKEVYGLTISPGQVQKGREMVSYYGLSEKVKIMFGDYTLMPFADNSVEAVYAIESSCYATGKDKGDLMEEIYRILKPGGRFVIADGFVKKKEAIKGYVRHIYRHMCNYWALEEMAQLDVFLDGLNNIGFKDIVKEDVSLNVGPSVMHIPFTVMKYLFATFIKHGNLKMTGHRKGNMLASVYGLLMGFHLHAFGYYLISGQKPMCDD